MRELERETGFEPATPTLARLCSTTELFPPTRVQRIVGRGRAVKRRDRPRVSTGKLLLEKRLGGHPW